MVDNNAHARLKIAIVAPVHIQPSKQWVDALKAISEGKPNVSVIIVDDSNGKVELPESFDVYGYDRQREEMGDDLYSRFERFHRSSACKNFGHWIAWRDGFDVVMGLDSDCIVPPNFIADHLESLMTTSHGWTNPIRHTTWFPRGYPMAERAKRTALSLGLWEGELDLYGTDRVENPGKDTKTLVLPEDRQVADGPLPLSGMNWAAWADCIPGLLFLPNFDYQHRPDVLYRFRRHDDIWGGYIFQCLMASRGERIVYGKPIVFHDTVVKPEEDAKEEEAMIAFEHDFYRQVDAIVAEVEDGMYEDMLSRFADIAMVQWHKTEFQPLAEALRFWADLFVMPAPDEEDDEEISTGAPVEA